MAILKKNAFSRRVPDLVTEELVAVLSRRTSFEFKQLFEILHENLQNLVARGMVKKNGKKYRGLPSALAKALIPPNGHIPAATTSR